MEFASKVGKFIKKKSVFFIGLALTVASWLLFFPGLYSVDSANAINNAEKFPVDSHLSVWWIYLVKLTSVNGSYVFTTSLFVGIVLYSSMYLLISEIVVPSLKRSAVVLNGLSPVFVGFSVSIWRDSVFVAGLILLTTIFVRVAKNHSDNPGNYPFRIFFAFIFLSTRQSGWLNVLLFFLLLFSIASFRNRAQIKFVAIFTLSLFVFGYLVALSSGYTSPAKPANSLQAYVGDIGCLVSKNLITNDESDLALLESIAPLSVWNNKDACFTSNVVIFNSSFDSEVLNRKYKDVVKLWIKSAAKNPKEMIQSRVERTSNFLPAFLFPKPSGWYLLDLSNPPAQESNWEPLNQGLQKFAKSFLAIANIQVDKVGYSGLWLWILIYLGLMGIKRNQDFKKVFVIMGFSSVLVNVGFAPEPDSRYGLFVLLLGQLFAIAFLLNWLRNDKIDSLNEN